MKFKEILNSIENSFFYETKTNISGVLKSLAVGFATRLADIQEKTRGIEKNYFVATADATSLFLLSNKQVKQELGSTSKGLVSVFGENGIVIKINEKLRTDTGLEFKTTEEKTISEQSFTGTVKLENEYVLFPFFNDIGNGTLSYNNIFYEFTKEGSYLKFFDSSIANAQSITIKITYTNISIESKLKGLNKNLEKNTVLNFEDLKNGVNPQALISKQLTEGKDAENLDDYRKKVSDYIQKPIAPFNENGIIYEIKKENPTILRVYVKGAEYVVGEVNIFCLNKHYDLTSDEITSVKKSVSKIKPVNLEEAKIKVQKPTVELVDVSISNLVPNNDNLKNEIKKNVKSVFEELQDKNELEFDIPSYTLESAIYGTKFQNIEVVSFTLVSGYKTKKTNTFYRLGKVNI